MKAFLIALLLVVGVSGTVQGVTSPTPSSPHVRHHHLPRCAPWDRVGERPCDRPVGFV